MSDAHSFHFSARPSARSGIRLPAVFTTAFSIALLVSGAPPAAAQFDRHDLGRRLLRFERAWEKAAAPDRAAVVDPLEDAVQSFFSMQFGRAAQRLDDAYLALRPGTRPPQPFELWAVSRKLDVSPRIDEPGGGKLELHLTRGYPTDAAVDSAEVLVTLKKADGTPVAQKSWTAEQLSNKQTWEAGPLAAGSYLIETTLRSRDGSEQFTLPAGPLERIERLRERIESLEAIRKSMLQDASVKNAPTTTSASLGHLLSVIKPSMTGATQEIDYPIAHLLTLAESLAVSPTGTDATREAVRTAACTGDAWLSLAVNKSRTTVRMRAPASAKQAMPILFLFHGAGGSENMFFETYGAGRAVELGINRGWLVVAPRQELLSPMMTIDDMTEAISEFYEVDRSRIFLLGHSMGAAQVMRQAAAAPALPRAAAALGGGSGLRDAKSVSRFPWYVAAGEKDFGRSGARALAKSLEGAGAQVTYHEPADVEHLVIVQAALDGVFEFFDKTNK